MNCTEEVAKTKWCPSAKATVGDGSFNRYNASELSAAKSLGIDEVPLTCKCLGSQCMAWIAGPGQDMVDPKDPERRFVAPNGRCGLINLRLTD